MKKKKLLLYLVPCLLPRTPRICFNTIKLNISSIYFWMTWVNEYYVIWRNVYLIPFLLLICCNLNAANAVIGFRLFFVQIVGLHIYYNENCSFQRKRSRAWSHPRQKKKFFTMIFYWSIIFIASSKKLKLLMFCKPSGNMFPYLLLTQNYFLCFFVSFDSKINFFPFHYACHELIKRNHYLLLSIIKLDPKCCEVIRRF